MSRAFITVEIHRGTIDPQGIGSDAECEACAEYVLDAVRTEFPDADVTQVGRGGRTSGRTADGLDLTADVRACVNAAFDAWCAS